MPLITVNQLAAEMRLTGDPSTAPEEPVLSKVTRLLTACNAYLERYIDGREITGISIDDELKNECIVLMASYIYDKPTSAGGNRYANSFINSGAKELITPFLSVSAGVV